MNGIINVYKPVKMTSHDVVSHFRKLFNIKKIGHTGTLDPDATGVLPICVGKATKIADYITNGRKKYRAELTLGISTDTQDASGNTIEEKEVNVTLEELNNTLQSFVGQISQIPPMYSAIKMNGKKLYQLAREGTVVERKPRDIEINNIEIVNYDGKSRAIFDVDCSKGTYIRTLCNDIGEKLGCGGHMSSLMRTATGNYKVEDSFTLEKIDQLYAQNEIDQFLKPIDSIFEHYPKVIIKDESFRWIQNGAQIYLKDIVEGNNFENVDCIRVYNNCCEFLALYKVINEDRVMFVPEIMFI